MPDLNVIWFFLVGTLLIGYAILDGFDLGIGALHLFARGDAERRTLINSIGPVWDGNEVWLVTGGGALFAAFPHAYATAFSGFYLAFMLLLFCLIFRAVALEFRSKEPWGWWRQMWDVAFSLASIVASILFGVAVGNMILGIPVGPDFEFQGSFLGLLQPYPIMVGLFNLCMFVMHGAVYLYLKTEGEIHEKAHRWAWRSWGVFLAFYMVMTVWTLVDVPSMLSNFRDFWWVWIIVALNVLAIANIPRCLHHRRPFRAFVSSACTIAAMVFLFGIGVYPNLIVSTMDSTYSLTIYNAASSEKTLGIMLVIAGIGMPFVLAYTVSIYWVFRGKVKLDPWSY